MENARDLEVNRFMEFGKTLLPILAHENREHWKQQNSYKAAKEGRKRYVESIGGQEKIREVAKRRKARFKLACEGLDDEEKRDIANFYKNKPKGYTVDHIIPISKGGLHRISNLQYMLPKENAVKAARLDYGIPIDKTKTVRMAKANDYLKESIKLPVKGKDKKKKKSSSVSQHFISIFNTLFLDL